MVEFTLIYLEGIEFLWTGAYHGNNQASIRVAILNHGNKRTTEIMKNFSTV